MRSEREFSTSAVTRRGFLKRAGAAAGAAGLVPAVSLPFVSTTLAEVKTLKILQWSHFVPQYDKWFDGIAAEWGKKNGVTVTVDHIPHLELSARAAAEVSAGAGHDIFAFSGSGGPHLYEKHVVDLSDLVSEVEKKHGKVQQIGRQIAYNDDTKAWSALPAYYISFPGLYRKDLWDEIGMKPDTWEDIRIGGAKLKAKGTPIGIGLGHSVDPNLSYRSMLWSCGASECDATGKRVTLNSKETLEVVKLVRGIYKDAMEPEVLSWDDASNNRLLASGRGSWIHNPISAYRSIQKASPELADKIYIWKTPAGPVNRLACGSPNSYVVWRFARNKVAAIEFLRYWTDNWVAVFEASTGYNHPLFENLVPKPMPILSNDPTSHPADKLQVLETADEWHATYGNPGPAGPASDEVAENFVIVDMMAKAATDKATPEEAVAWAQKEIELIYKKWSAA